MSIFGSNLSSTVGATKGSSIPVGIDPILSFSNPDLIVAYTGDDVSGSTVNDSSPNGSNGTITGGVTQSPGAIGNALGFNGTDGLVSSTYGGASDNDNTISLWFRSADSNGVLWAQGTSFDTATFRAVYFDSGNLIVEDRIAGASSVFHSVGGYNDGVDHHLRVYWGSTYFEYYIDDVLIQQVAKASVYTAFTNNVYLGGISGTGSLLTYDYSGLIDEYRYFNRELTTAEGTTLANEA